MYRFKLLTSLIFICCATASYAQLNIQAERNNAHYEVGEIGYFNITGAQQTSLNYRIYYDAKTPNIESGKIDVNIDGTAKIAFEAAESGVYLCEIVQSELIDVGAMSFSPNQISIFEDEPADFDLFWETEKAKLATIPIDPILTFHDTYEDRTIYKVNFSTVENRRVYGYLTVPNAEGKYPGILTLPPFGSAANIVTPETFLSVQANAVVLTIGIHNADVNEADPNAYNPDVLTDPSRIYMKNAILAGVRAIDYIHTLEQFDGENLVVNGVSQGGGLSMCVAGADQRVDVLGFSNSALCQHSGTKYQRASGFPYYYNTSTAGTDDLNTVNNAIKYVEAGFFARRFKGPVYGTLSYEDLICPAATVYAAYNEFRCPKVLISMLNLEHSTPNDYWSDRVPFFRHFIPEMTTPEIGWLSNFGYLADAGQDQTTSLNNPISLSGTISFDKNERTDWPVFWEKVEGPGAVQFLAQNSHQTEVRFSQKGVYTLKFYTYIDDFVEDQEKRITVEDYITIIVE